MRGYGSRLRPLTDRLPKPLLPAGGRPALFAAMDKLRPAGIRDFFVNVHHLPEKFAEAFGLPAGTFADSRVAEARYKDCRVRLVCEPEILDTGGAVKNLLPLLDLSKPLAVHNGDIIFSSPAEEFLAAAEANLADKNCAATLCLRSSGNLPNVGVGDSGDVRDMRFALGAPFGRLAQYAGFFVLNPPAFKFFADRAEDKFSIVETFLDVLRSGGRLAGIFDDAGDWADIGTLSEYARLGAEAAPDGWTALARLCVAGFSPDKGEVVPVSKGASARKFYKFARDGEKLVACFYAENPRENFLYAPLAEFLHGRGIPVPEVKFHDPQSRMIVMRDAGARDLGAVPPADRRKFYFDALRAAKKVHSISAGEFARAGIELCPPFDGALYAWEPELLFRRVRARGFRNRASPPRRGFRDAFKGARRLSAVAASARFPVAERNGLRGGGNRADRLPGNEIRQPPLRYGVAAVRPVCRAVRGRLHRCRVARIPGLYAARGFPGLCGIRENAEFCGGRAAFAGARGIRFSVAQKRHGGIRKIFRTRRQKSSLPRAAVRPGRRARICRGHFGKIAKVRFIPRGNGCRPFCAAPVPSGILAVVPSGAGNVAYYCLTCL